MFNRIRDIIYIGEYYNLNIMHYKLNGISHGVVINFTYNTIRATWIPLDNFIKDPSFNLLDRLKYAISQSNTKRS